MTAFGDAFKAARKKAGGGGGTFKFGGKSYNTKIKEEVSKPASRKSSGKETGAPIVITGGGRKGVTSATPAKNNSGITGGMFHPAVSAIHKANVTNTAPGSNTKYSGPGLSLNTPGVTARKLPPMPRKSPGHPTGR